MKVSAAQPFVPLRGLDALMRQQESLARATHHTSQPPVGFLALAGPQGARAAVVAPPREAREGFDAFMAGTQVKVARSLWSLVAPAVPPAWRNGVTAAWIVLDATAIFARANRTLPVAGPSELLELSVATLGTAIDALSLVNAAAGRPTQDIGQLGLALRYGSEALGGKNIAWLDLHARAARSSPIYRTADGVLKLVEAGLSDHPDFKGVALNPVRGLANPSARSILDLGLTPAKESPA